MGDVCSFGIRCIVAVGVRSEVGGGGDVGVVIVAGGSGDVVDEEGDVRGVVELIIWCY